MTKAKSKKLKSKKKGPANVRVGQFSSSSKGGSMQTMTAPFSYGTSFSGLSHWKFGNAPAVHDAPGGGLRVTFRFLYAAASTVVSGTVTEFTAYNGTNNTPTLFLHPNNSTFPSGFASFGSLFSRFRFSRLKVDSVPLCGSGTPGQILLGYEADPNRAVAFNSATQVTTAVIPVIANLDASVGLQGWARGAMDVKLGDSLHYTGSASNTIAANVWGNSQGAVLMAIIGNQSANYTYSAIWLEGDLDLYGYDGSYVGGTYVQLSHPPSDRQAPPPSLADGDEKKEVPRASDREPPNTPAVLESRATLLPPPCLASQQTPLDGDSARALGWSVLRRSTAR